MAAVSTSFILTKSASSTNKLDHCLVKIKPSSLSLNLNRHGRVQPSLTRRPLTVQATYSDGGRPGSASIFVGGFLLGGLIVGTLGCVYAPQVLFVTIIYFFNRYMLVFNGIHSDICLKSSFECTIYGN